MKTTNKHCEYCNIEFIAKRFDAKFCSGACKQNAYLDRLRNFDEKRKTENLIQQNQIAERINQLEQQLTEAQKKKEAQLQQEQEEQSNYMNKFFETFKHDETERNKKDANKILKGWLEQILAFNQQEETYLFKVKSLCDDIIRFHRGHQFNSLPKDYQHWKFINDTLFPKANNWYNGIKNSRERYITLHLSDELKVKFTHVLSLIDR